MLKRAEFFSGLALGLALLFSTSRVDGQVLNVLHSFSALESSTNNDGVKPYGGLTMGWDGSWYGSAEEGGTNQVGTIFKITPQGNFVLVHAFSAFVGSANADGAYPVAALTPGLDGSLYGVSSGGGTNGNYGTVFNITKNDDFVVLHTFDYSDGENPSSPLVRARDGSFYGAAVLGGDGQSGTIFQITSNGGFQTLYNFTATTSSDLGIYTNNDGARPYGLTLGFDGNLYGTTELGGTNGEGTVFQFTTNGDFNLLHTFSAQNATNSQNYDGASPTVPLTQGLDDGFYGTTPNGGADAGGTISRVTASGSFSTLLNFDYFTNGANSDAPLVFHNGALFGTTGDIYSGGGAIFEVTTNGALTLLYAFSPLGTNSDNADGASIQTVTLGRDGNLYGTAVGGGINGNGTIFSLNLPLLTISNANSLTTVAWPTNQVGFSLQWTTNLANSSWALDPNAATNIGNGWVVTNADAGRATFYRLIK